MSVPSVNHADPDVAQAISANPIGRYDAIRTLVVDDHDVVRDGVAVILERARRAKVVGFASNGEDAVRAAKYLEPEVIVMDLLLPILDGIEATRRIVRELPQTHVIMLSGCHAPEPVYSALRAGAQGYVLKSMARADLPNAVHAVIAGDKYVSPAITALFVNGVLASTFPTDPLDRLSTREREILRHIVAGSSSAAIALLLSLSRKTIDTYRSRMMVKLGVANRSALIRLALRHSMHVP
jgi:DNA-binding NarL/FixJ family response regulator